MSELKWMLADLDGNPLSLLTGRLPGGSVHIALNDQRTAEVSIPLEDEAAQFATAFDSSLLAWLDGDLIFRGIVTLPRTEASSDSGTGTLSIAATDPSAHLEELWALNGRFLDLTDLSLPEAIGIVVNRADIMKGTAGGPPWEYSPRGNGIAIGSLPDGPHASRTVTDGQNLWELITDDFAAADISDAIGTDEGAGADFELTPVEGIGETMVELNCFFPRQGSDKTGQVFFEYGFGRHNLADFALEPGGGQITNQYTVQGPKLTTEVIDGNDYDVSVCLQARHLESMARYGVYAAYETNPDLILETGGFGTMYTRATTVVAARALPIDFCEITPTAERGADVMAWSRRVDGEFHPLPDQGLGAPPRFGPHADYYMGDTVSILARQAPGLDVETAGRVTEANITEVDDAGTVVVEITTVPHNAAAAGVSVIEFSAYTLTGPHHPKPHHKHNNRRHHLHIPNGRPGGRLPGPSVNVGRGRPPGHRGPANRHAGLQTPPRTGPGWHERHGIHHHPKP